MNAILISLIASTTFWTGAGEWRVAPDFDSTLSRDENQFVKRSMAQYDDCLEADCQKEVLFAIRDVVNLRRSLNDDYSSPAVFNALRLPCERVAGTDIVAARECFGARQGLAYPDAMSLAGFSQAGVSTEGYRQLKSGLRMKDVEFILGGPGEEISYSSAGGYSYAVYAWTRGNQQIIVSFEDEETTGRTQSGLF